MELMKVFLKNKKVLVIDDERGVIRLIEVILKRHNIQVVPAENPLVGIAMARSLKPNLIIVDMSLPSMSGLDVCQILKEDKTTKDIPIFIISVFPIGRV